MSIEPPIKPDWDQLYRVAETQEGLFTTQQAAQAGYSPQLLAHYVRIGRASRVQRGIYRLVHFPAGEHEDLVAVWLWSEQVGTFSHQTALALYDLSDVLPARIHLTLPESWRKRRLRVPRLVVLHYADLLDSERHWVGAVRATTPSRTLDDCARGALTPDLMRQAALQALHRGMVRGALPAVEEALKPFGGLNA
ncbi:MULTISPECIES: type IV toxin-antitoxin system AbiEi family antitoxin domain-containing protein [unclassified Corallococcus]|uniref:type IV toxin-antitoxin system AbiEi family antitoxin domain-containing protein n=1 Tax=unclassified Corallococcus TaxID=2685029 RepID=UPI001A8ED8F4|nr:MULTISPECIES: type IV toxin-antitoxin system AbiEi family antitoxin domain-containing protein [unclassified Corallococcus]MBN9681947.1 type IV toxin-antitoxin system AbiEi family antitoxin domain-containing protein [Corallococcus sp. NCSPR001]WAS86487.1 type IV toxin-antitoxin system AbiEi family antitoxin domain-containing protein [Corallococcus sp. NCRR]